MIPCVTMTRLWGHMTKCGSLVTPKTQFYLQLDYLRLLNCLVGFVFSLVCSWRMVLMSLCCRLPYLPWEGWHFKGNFFANVNGSPNMHGSFSKNGPFYLIKLSLAMQFYEWICRVHPYLQLSSQNICELCKSSENGMCTIKIASYVKYEWIPQQSTFHFQYAKIFVSFSGKMRMDMI